MSKKEVSMKAKLETAKVVSYLEDLVKTMKEGTVCIQNDGDYVIMKPGPHIEIEIEAEQKKGKERVRIDLFWRNKETLNTDVGLSISSTEPTIPAEDEVDSSPNSTSF